MALLSLQLRGDKNYWFTLPRWRNLCHRLSHDQPQPGSFFQRPREAEKRDPGNEVGNITQHHKENVFSSFVRSFGSFWLVLLVVLGGFTCFWLLLAGNYERFAQALALQMETQTVEVKVCKHSFLFYKNLVFSAQAEYSYFSADFWLKHSCIILN